MPISNHALYYEQDPRVPMTHLNLVFRGSGIQQEPEEKTGLARFVAKMLFRGTATLTREEISHRCELLGAEVSAHVTETDFVVAVSCFTENLANVLALVETILREADFPQHELELLTKAEFNQLEGFFQEPERVLSAAHQYVLYDGHSLGKPGSLKGMNTIVREDLAGFFSNVLTSTLLYVTAISDLPQDGIERTINRFMDKRGRTGFELKPEIPFREFAATEAFIVHSEASRNDRLIWSQRGLTATDDRRFDLSLIVDALGSFEGYLFDELRNKRGWCYGAYGFLVPATTRPGRLGFYADPSLEASEQLIPELLRLLSTFQRDESFTNRLTERNETFKNRYAYQLDLKFKLVSRVNRDRYGVPILDREAYRRRIDRVTRESALRVIDDLFDPKRLSMVFYGDADRVQRALHDLGFPIRTTIIRKELLVA